MVLPGHTILVMPIFWVSTSSDAVYKVYNKIFTFSVVYCIVFVFVFFKGKKKREKGETQFVVVVRRRRKKERGGTVQYSIVQYSTVTSYEIHLTYTGY